VVAELLHQLVERRLVAVGLDDEGLEAIRDDAAWQASKKEQRLDDAVGEVGRPLTRQGDGKSVLAEGKNGRQNLRLMDFSGALVDPRDGRSGVVELEKVAGLML
jgi:hypothetical protein